MNNNIPKSHQKLIDKYCKNKYLYDSYTEDMEKTNSEYEELSKEKEQFQKNGTVNHDFLQKLLHEYENLLKMQINTNNLSRSFFEEYIEIEKQLQKKGYNTEELYNDYLASN